MNELRSFRKISGKAQTTDLIKLLNKNNIKCNVTEVSNSTDLDFSDNKLNNYFEIKLLQSDFETATKILDQIAEESISMIDETHYLFEFENDELYDILTKPDEWNELDYKLAQKILNDRGQKIDQNDIDEYKLRRLKTLSKPEKNHIAWLIFGYISSLAGGLWGIVIGWYIWRGKKTLPNGEKILIYNENDRKHGQIIFFLGLAIFPFTFVYRLYFYDKVY